MGRRARVRCAEGCSGLTGDEIHQQGDGNVNFNNHGDGNHIHFHGPSWGGPPSRPQDPDIEFTKKRRLPIDQTVALWLGIFASLATVADLAIQIAGVFSSSAQTPGSFTPPIDPYVFAAIAIGGAAIAVISFLLYVTIKFRRLIPTPWASRRGLYGAEDGRLWWVSIEGRCPFDGSRMLFRTANVEQADGRVASRPIAICRRDREHTFPFSPATRGA